MKKEVYILGLFTIWIVIPSSAQPLRFTQETIRIEIRPDSYRLDGRYVFENEGPTPVRRSIFYPFSQTGMPPESVSVDDEDMHRQIPFSQSELGLSLTISVPSYTTKGIRVKFVQRAPQHRLEYILTTTGDWGRPLDRARFFVWIPNSCKLLQLSLDPDKIIEDTAGKTYSVIRENFMPRHNLILTWQRSVP